MRRLLLYFFASTAVAATHPEFAKPKHIPAPADNISTKERVELGKLLFFDPRLSSTGTFSCASCHNPSLGWEDGLPKGVGLGQAQLSRKVPTILNSAWIEAYAWDGRAPTLEAMSKIPIVSPKIMNTTLDEIAAKLRAIPYYKEAFARAYPKSPIGEDTILKALAAFERSVVATKAPFDRWVAGDEHAISAQAKEGFKVFTGQGKCVECHSGWNFSDESFQDIGVNDADIGAGAQLKLPKMQHAFKVPTLRDVARRAPYMHDGSEPTLMSVVDFYNQGGKAKRPSLAHAIQPLHLSEKQRLALVEFLKTLSSDEHSFAVPVLPSKGI